MSEGDLSKKRRMEEYETVALIEVCSTILQRKLPSKLRDPGSCTIPCTIGNFECKHALCDLGASINLMSLSIFPRLGLGEASPTTVTLQLADCSVKHLRGIIEDVLVKVEKINFLIDFIVLDMEEDENVPIILGRPFLATGQALIDVVDMVEKAVAGINITEDPLQRSLTTEDVEAELDKEVQWMNSKEPIYNRKYEELGQGPERPLPSVEKPLELELNSLSAHLQYAFLDEKETSPVIVSSSLSNEEMEKLLRIFKVVRKEILKWLDAGVIYPISDSSCVNPVQAVPKK
ncbi:uncharacterized protein LOC133814747 [Humulus lupulus]|uniref:uncharacterized protein LOC133814747 n=1 Tax=Humulus lupulus TaxID=3486 RepID=UPI002B4167BA|nr:uncharacterized protein LOC133814747 [Humulus lupulus]